MRLVLRATVHLLPVLAVVALSHAASGQPAPGFEQAGPPIAADIRPDSGDLTLSDGREIHLMGLEIPRQEPGGRSQALQSLADQSKQAVAAMLAAGPPSVWTAPGAEPDRWGRIPALVVTADGRLIQAELLRQGLARVMPADSGDDPAVAALLVAEEPARMAKAGLWAHPRYAVRRPDEIGRLIDTMQVVEGRITSVNATKNALYLNLGDDKRRNLGIRVAKRVIKLFTPAPSEWVGRTVRIRGFVGKSIGPLIELWHPGQIELLPETAS